LIAAQTPWVLLLCAQESLRCATFSARLLPNTMFSCSVGGCDTLMAREGLHVAQGGSPLIEEDVARRGHGEVVTDGGGLIPKRWT
jgi:hypothetical protein